MQHELGYELSDAGRGIVPSENNLFESLADVARDLQDVINALALLGIVRCSQCKQFSRASDAGAIFDYGKLVCYGCVPHWWSSLSSRISIADREVIEAKLAAWLRKYHGAIVVKETPGKTLETVPSEFSIVAKCAECGGSGKLLEGERCRFCNGFGTVWIVVPK